MTSSRTDRAERRGHPRIVPKGSVRLQALGKTRRGRIGNIARGGLLVFTDVTELDGWRDRDIDLELRFDGARGDWLGATGRIVRIQDLGLALAFVAPSSADLLHAIGELTTASHAHARVMSVLLIDAEPTRRSTMAAGFRAVGCTVEEAATPLEAIVWLGATNFEPDVIAVADSRPDTAADDMRVFVERDHPEALLVTIGDELLPPYGMARWLSSADPKADLAARVLEVLVLTVGHAHARKV